MSQNWVHLWCGWAGWTNDRQNRISVLLKHWNVFKCVVDVCIIWCMKKPCLLLKKENTVHTYSAINLVKSFCIYFSEIVPLRLHAKLTFNIQAMDYLWFIKAHTAPCLLLIRRMGKFMCYLSGKQLTLHSCHSTCSKENINIILAP